MLQQQGALKKTPTDLGVYLINFRGTNQPPICFFLEFLSSSCFWAFLGKGEFKNTTKMFEKSPCQKLPPKKSTKISMSGFPRLVLFYRVFGCFSAMGVQKPRRKRFYKKILSKSFNKKIGKKPKTVFFSICFNRVFGCFLVKGIKTKHDKKLTQKPDQPWCFFGLRGTNQSRQAVSCQGQAKKSDHVVLLLPCRKKSRSGPLLL
jgi:hypothetical protein